MQLKKGDKIGITGCSNAQPISNRPKIEMLLKTVSSMGLVPVLSNCIFEKYSVFSGKAEERAEELMKFYSDSDIKAIFDISGGDVANQILDYIDFELIRKNPKPFFGYSDLTTIINAIYTKTQSESYLYQIQNLIYNNGEVQIKRFINSIFNGGKDLFDINYSFIQGEKMAGTVIGGNVRCLLKLAGTSYMPDFNNKILLLEACGGDAALITAYFSQLKQMGTFSKVNGVLLGTFTKMEKDNIIPAAEEILINTIQNSNLPIAKTNEIGHSTDSKCLIIGKYLQL